MCLQTIRLNGKTVLGIQIIINIALNPSGHLIPFGSNPIPRDSSSLHFLRITGVFLQHVREGVGMLNKPLNTPRNNRRDGIKDNIRNINTDSNRVEDRFYRTFRFSERINIRNDTSCRPWIFLDARSSSCSCNFTHQIPTISRERRTKFSAIDDSLSSKSFAADFRTLAPTFSR